MRKSIYAASVLRYIHDQASGEFVNVAVIVYCAERGYFFGSVLQKTHRVSQFFPEVRGTSLRRTLIAVRRQLEQVAKSRVSEGSALPFSAAMACERVIGLAHQIVPKDDSAFQWSDPFTGLSSEPASTLDHLFERLVTRYDDGYDYQKRSDNQVWTVFSKALENRNLSSRLEEHEIKSNLESVKFKHALKNGRWHLLEPISFDLVNPESIKDKAKRILGQMTVLKDSTADFELHFLVGEPSGEASKEAFDVALKILAKVPVPSKIYSESMKDTFADEISRIAALHHLN